MLRRLSEFGLGISMPHTHGQQAGDLQALPDEIVQVESGLRVSFRPTQQIASQEDRFLPVGWVWRAGVATPVAVCEMVWQDGHSATQRNVKHQMPEGI